MTSTAPNLIDRIQAAGATIVLEQGQARLRGKKLPDALMAEIKTNRDALIAEMQRRETLDKDRFGKVPSHELPFTAMDLEFPMAHRCILERHMIKQGHVVHAWIEKRAGEYHAKGRKVDDIGWRACIDLIAWQRRANVMEAWDFVKTLDDVATKNFPDEPGKKTESRL